MSIELPPLPSLLEWPHSHEELRDLEVARIVMKAAANVLSEHRIPVGNSAAGEMACEWTYEALKECRDQIKQLEFKHY